MDYKIINSSKQKDFNDLFKGKRLPESKYTRQHYLMCHSKFSEQKRKLPIEILSSLEFIEILIDFYTPAPNKYLVDNNTSKISFGEFLHIDSVTNTEVYEDFKKHEGIYTEKHVKLYYSEIFALIRENNPYRTTNEKFNSLTELISKFHGFNHRFEKHVVNFLNINNIIYIEKEIKTPVEYDFHQLMVLLKTKINPSYIKLAKDLEDYINGIDPLTLKWVVEEHTFPPFWDEAKILKMKGGKKSDVVRFADFFGITISQINCLFLPKVDSNNRNKESKTGIYQILKKYPELKAKNNNP